MEYKFNEDQEKVINSNSKNIICMAGAGTGKTHTLISRICNLVNNRNADPRSMLVLTFTRAAAGEFESRYNLLSDNLNKPFFGTFHSFCYNLLVFDNDVMTSLGYKKVPSIIEQSYEDQLKQEALELSGAKLKKECLKINYNPSASEKLQFKVYEKTFNKLLKTKNLITYDLLCKSVCDLFINKDTSITKYLYKYKYIFVDEFQDTNQIQWDFVKSFDGICKIMLVGDIRQSIYSFCGADSSIMKSIINSDEFETLKLQTNYRSTKQICNFANEFLSTYNDDFEEIQLISEKDGPYVEEISMMSFKENIEFICAPNNKSLAILARTNKEVDDIKKYLKSRYIPFEQKKNRKNTSVYMAAIDEKYMLPYLNSQLTTQQVSHLLKQKHIEGDSFNELKYLQSLLPDHMKLIREVRNSSNFGELQMMYFNGEIRIEDIEADINVKRSNIYVGTIHSVKGLEFDEVYVTGVDSSRFKLISEENKNLYYVACTRPKERLIIVR